MKQTTIVACTALLLSLALQTGVYALDYQGVVPVPANVPVAVPTSTAMHLIKKLVASRKKVAAIVLSQKIILPVGLAVTSGVISKKIRVPVDGTTDGPTSQLVLKDDSSKTWTLSFGGICMGYSFVPNNTIPKSLRLDQPNSIKVGDSVTVIGTFCNPLVLKRVSGDSFQFSGQQTTTADEDTSSSVDIVAKNSDSSVSVGPHVYTSAELLAMADNKYANGGLPLGDKHYVTDAPKVGYVYFCNVPGNNGVGGAGTDGPWIHGDTWNPAEKTHVSGDVAWKNAKFSDTVSSSTRDLAGNGLPISHTTGTYPVASSDPAYQYDRNPNSIKTQNLKLDVPANPTYQSTPNCMSMESGIMLSGVPLFGAFDAELRDAPAHELQDSCSGHPEVTGQYHYHSESKCFKDDSVTKVLGYALDGFPITGGKVADNKYLTTEDLDVCHGLTSTITVDGKSVTTYHYVMTQDFPYSVSCFRGKPIRLQTASGSQGQGQGSQQGGMMGQNGQQGQSSNSGQGGMTGQQGQTPSNSSGQVRTPPQEAITACSSKKAQNSCSFQTPNGTMNGTCGTPPNSTTLACMPSGMMGGPQQ